MIRFALFLIVILALSWTVAVCFDFHKKIGEKIFNSKKFKNDEEKKENTDV